MTTRKVVRTLGRYSAYSLRAEAGWGLEVIPGYGARLNALWLCDGPLCLNVIDGLEAEAEPENAGPYHNVLLFPFVNRLDGGSYRHENRAYRFALNEPARGNALHGLLYDAPFRLVRAETAATFATIALRHEYDGGNPGYPFPFRVDVAYCVRPRACHVELNVRNTGATRAPVALGWHPYFTLGVPLEALRLTAPSARRILVDTRMLPIGSVEDTSLARGVSFGSVHLDACFQLSPAAEALIAIESDAVCLTLRPGPGLDYLQVFTPARRRSLAVEPMSAAIDALNNHMGLRTVAPGDVFTMAVDLKLHRI